MKKIKYIFKKLFIIFLIAFISIFIYEIFTQYGYTKEQIKLIIKKLSEVDKKRIEITISQFLKA